MIEQRSDEWFAQRLGRVTASKVKDVMAKGRSGAPSATRQNYMMQLLCERLTGKREEGFTSAAMQRGTDLEPIARSAYEFNAGVMTIETGLIIHPRIDGFAASPDGLAGSMGSSRLNARLPQPTSTRCSRASTTHSTSGRCSPKCHAAAASGSTL